MDRRRAELTASGRDNLALISTFEPSCGSFASQLGSGNGRGEQAQSSRVGWPQSRDKPENVQRQPEQQTSSELAASAKTQQPFWFKLMRAAKATNYLLSCLLGLNVFLSIVNTFLLALVVKSIQDKGASLLQVPSLNKLSWDAHTESLALDAILKLNQSSTLFASSVEALDERRLIVGQIERDFNGGESMTPSSASATTRGGQQILIVAKSSGGGGGHDAPPDGAEGVSPLPPSSDSNFILIKAQPPANRERPSVQIATKSLIINQQVERHANSALAGGKKQMKGLLLLRKHAGQGDSTTTTTTTATSDADADYVGGGNTASTQAAGSRRLLELDAERHSIVLAHLRQLNLLPASSKTLFVHDEFRVRGEISGAPSENFE